MNQKYPEPNFICIGPHKTGTAWLYKTLGAHKDVKKSIIKELDYFLIQDIKSKGILASIKFQKSHLNRVIKRRLISKNIKQIFSKSSAPRKRIEYHLRILLGLYSDKFYSSFFQKEAHQIVGDISPAYYALEPSTIQKIKDFYPKIKVIVFLREPLSRISSHVKMMHAYDNIPTDEQKIKRNIEFLKKNSEKGLYPYHGLRNWLSIFDKEQVFVGFYDAFKKDPVAYYQNICRFLNISDKLDQAIHYQNIVIGNNKINHTFAFAEDLIKYRYNSSKIKKIEIPTAVINSLCNHYYKDVQLLADYIDSPYPKEWLKYYDTLTQNT